MCCERCVCGGVSKEEVCLVSMKVEKDSMRAEDHPIECVSCGVVRHDAVGVAWEVIGGEVVAAVAGSGVCYARTMRKKGRQMRGRRVGGQREDGVRRNKTGRKQTMNRRNVYRSGPVCRGC
eukprot:GHVQ01005708.1.p1 GENE.GHVQ01005708.1~~GHVQ01005708.1.p1  ORF type:complete len:121 (+),score=38.90 GHVQ01005708.1:114-476(+)